MSLTSFKLTKNSSYEVQIISYVHHGVAYPIDMYVADNSSSIFILHFGVAYPIDMYVADMTWVSYKWEGKLEVGLPRISFRTNIFQQHTCHTF